MEVKCAVKFPKIGMRIVKTAIAVFICFVIDMFRTTSMPFYSAIAAILCMQPDVKDSWRVAATRTIGDVYKRQSKTITKACRSSFCRG